MKKLKKLPIGIQTFQDIRDPKENYIYIDKTKEAFGVELKEQYKKEFEQKGLSELSKKWQ